MPRDASHIPPGATHYQLQVDAVNGARAPFDLQPGQTARFKVADPRSTWTINGRVCGPAGNGTPLGPSGATEGAISVQRRPSWSVIKPDLTKYFMKVDDAVDILGPGVIRLAGHYVHRGPPDGSSSGSILVDAYVF